MKKENDLITTIHPTELSESFEQYVEAVKTDVIVDELRAVRNSRELNVDVTLMESFDEQ